MPAEIGQWTVIEALLDSCLKASEDSEKDRYYEIYVSAEEIFTNIASYAYEGKQDGKVEVSCELEADGTVWMSFRDWGTPYNPLARPDPDFDIPFEQRRIGGLGIYMVKRFMDEVTYQYQDGSNLLVMKKKQEQ